eukprot:CAMPEP_0170133778 /NCGR_PEP_ID=MMETSP0033_2-20121228/1534_1 /TAXON_ID=195969 /ORGANISM="Dolichomastix tenuilepis, Strain CCMP3274" /LENGTH=825 /DNA_ID=CAMNT_0010369305 /DNA_START=150 /DNA_END=2627 /DNA_ORIENTATION=+
MDSDAAEWETALALLVEDASTSLHDRHASNFARLARIHPHGFAVQELGYVEKMLVVGLERVKGEHAALYLKPVCEYVRALGVPFVRRTTTDEVKGLALTSSLMKALCAGLEEGSPPEVVCAAAEAIASFTQAGGSRPWASAEEGGSLTRQYLVNQRVMEKASVATAVAGAFGRPASASGAGEQLALLKAALVISHHDTLAVELVRAGALSKAAAALGAAGLRDEALFLAIELLWNLLVAAQAHLAEANEEKATAAAASVTPALAAKMKELLEAGYRVVDKELRNELFICAQLVASLPAGDSALLASGVCSPVLAVATEAGDAKPFLFTATPEDYELKRLSWTLACQLAAAHPSALAAAYEAGLLAVLLAHLEEGAAPLMRWSRSQAQELQVAALTGLAELLALEQAPLAPSTCEHVVACVVGFAKLTHERFAPGGEESAQLSAAMRVMRTPTLAGAFGAGEALPVLLRLFMDQHMPEGLREDAAATLSALCEGCAENREVLRKVGGVQAMQEALAVYTLREPSLSAAPCAATVAATWTCILPDRRSLARFLALEGVETLLALLEAGNAAVRPAVLSCLADIFQNPKSHRFFHGWVSPVSGTKAAPLLLALWREQEDILGVHASGADVVIDATAKRPLSTTERAAQWKTPSLSAVGVLSDGHKSLNGSIQSNMQDGMILVKLYAVIIALGFETLAETLASAKDLATLQAVQAFVELKEGAVWCDIKTDLANDGLKPVGPDRARLQEALDTLSGRMQTLQGDQSGILKQAAEEAAKAEQAFYDEAHAQHRMEAEAKVFKRNRSTLTMKERLEAKLQKEKMLANSMIH